VPVLLLLPHAKVIGPREGKRGRGGDRGRQFHGARIQLEVKRGQRENRFPAAHKDWRVLGGLPLLGRRLTKIPEKIVAKSLGRQGGYRQPPAVVVKA